MSHEISPNHSTAEKPNADTVYYAHPGNISENHLPSGRFSSFSYKWPVLIFFLTIVLIISNELVFNWAKQLGISKEAFPYRHPDFSLTGSTRPIAMDFDSENNLWIIGGKYSPAPVGKWSYFITTLIPGGSAKTYKSGWGEATSLAVDSDNQVWFGGEFGLRRLTEQGKWIPVWDKTLQNKHVYALAADHQGQLWLVTKDYLSKYMDGKWTHLPVENIQSLAIDPLGQVWFLDQEDNLAFLKPDGNWEYSSLPLHALAITTDTQGNLWARVDNGIAICNTGTKKCSVYRSYNSEISPAATKAVMAFDSDGRLWLPYSTYSSTIRFYVVDVDKVTPANILNGLVISRLALWIVLALVVYFFVVIFFDARKKKSAPEPLTSKGILKKMALTIILLGLVGPVLAMFTIWVFIRPDIFTPGYLAILFIGIIGSAVMLIRMFSLMTTGFRISNKDLAVSALTGGLLTIGVMLISFYTIFRIIMLMLIGY